MAVQLPAAALDELLVRLEMAGLDRKEGQLYANLVVRGPLRASELAGAAGLNRTESYRTLKQMMARGWVRALLEKPTRFQAVPPQKVFDDLRLAHRAHAARLEETAATTLALLERLQAEGAPAAQESAYQVLHGREAIYAAVEGMLQRAKEGQWMVSTYFAPPNATAANQLFATTRRLAGEGLAMRLLVMPRPGLATLLAPFSKPGVEIRAFEPASPLRFTIVDGREIMYWLQSDPSPRLSARGDVALWTNATDFVSAQRALYESLWQQGRPFA